MRNDLPRNTKLEIINDGREKKEQLVKLRRTHERANKRKNERTNKQSDQRGNGRVLELDQRRISVY